MEDIDQTFYKLKRKSLTEVLLELSITAKVETLADPVTYLPVVRIKKEYLDEAGWSPSEVISVLTGMGVMVILHRDIYRITYQ